MSVKRLPLVEPVLQDTLYDRVGMVHALRFLLIGLGAAVLLSQVAGIWLSWQHRWTGKTATRMYWNFVEPAMFMHHEEEEPFEPFLHMRHLMQPGEPTMFMHHDEEPFEPTLYGRHLMQPVEPTVIMHQEIPFEPMVENWHVMQPVGIPEHEQHNIDLWPRQRQAYTAPVEEGSTNFFPRRDPFKNITKETELPAGRYVSRSYVSQSHIGPDGKPVTERYASSAAGNGEEGIHEAKHLYSNSSFGLAKASHEQHFRGRSRMAITEYSKGVQSTPNQIFHGMNVTENAAFGQEFEVNAKHLPDRAKLGKGDLIEPLSNFHDRGPALG